MKPIFGFYLCKIFAYCSGGKNWQKREQHVAKNLKENKSKIKNNFQSIFLFYSKK